MNKKLIVAILAVSMAASQAAAFAEGTENELLSQTPAVGQLENSTYEKQLLYGTVVTTEDNQITVKEGDSEFIINTDAKTLFTSTEGAPVAFADIKSGDVLNIVADKKSTRSIPAQNYGYVVIKGDGKSTFPVYCDIKSVEQDEEKNTHYISADGFYSITLSEDTELAAFKTKQIVSKEDLTEGTRVLVYSNIMTMSIPAMMPATKIVVLPAEEKETKVCDKISVNGEEITTKPVSENDNYLVPVRQICEKLGLSVEWDASLKAVSVGTVQMGINFNIGVNSYNKAKMTPSVLGSAPVLIDGVTYIPVEFFSDLLEAEVDTTNGIISINYQN